MSLFGAVLEVCVRTLFFNSFIFAGFKTGFKDMDRPRRIRYAQWGRMRVTDGNNDMVVEYISSVTAALFVVFLQPTGAFSFASEGEVETGIVVAMLMYQLVPELFLDLYVTFMEIHGGLWKVHQVSWSWTAGGDKESASWIAPLGDLPKSITLKFGSVVCFTGFVLLVAVKA